MDVESDYRPWTAGLVVSVSQVAMVLFGLWCSEKLGSLGRVGDIILIRNLCSCSNFLIALLIQSLGASTLKTSLILQRGSELFTMTV